MWKQAEAQAERLAKELGQAREELNLCVQEKNTVAKEMKSYLKETDFKLNQELCVLREVIEEKQKIIDGLKHKQADQAKRLSEENFRRELNLQSYQDTTADKLKWMTDEITNLNKQIGVKD